MCLLLRRDSFVISTEGWEQNICVLNPQALVKSKQWVNEYLARCFEEQKH